MGSIGSPRARNGRGICVLAVGMALSMLAVLPRTVPAAPSAVPASALPQAQATDPRAALEEFRAICEGLTAAREQLANGRLDETAFADSILALFERADSLAQRLAAGPRGPSWLTLQRGTGYLIESLRENWIGIAAKNGMSFADADMALKAALAWRSDVVEVAVP